MARKVKVDMTDVESFVKCEEGEHIAKITEINEDTPKGGGDDMLVAKFEVTKGSSKGATIYSYLSLGEKALWKLKGLLEAIGMKSEGRLVLDLDKMEGKTCIIEVFHEEYNGSTRAKIDSFKKLDAPKSRDEDDDDDDDDDEDEAPPAKKKKPSEPPKKSKRPPVEDDDDDEDDEDDEPAPKKKKGKPEPKPDPKAAKKKKRPADDDDDEDWDED